MCGKGVFQWISLLLALLAEIHSISGVKRGPHHPRSEQSTHRKVDQHLTHEEHRIEDDLHEMGINVNLDEMTEDEKHFYYFQSPRCNIGHVYVYDDEEEDEEMLRKQRKVWVKNWVMLGSEEGFCAKLYRELREEETDLHRTFVRMTPEQFDHLLALVTPHIMKQDTVMRKSVSPLERLLLTLRFLATGESFSSLQFLFRIPQPTISTIIPEVLDALYTVLVGEYLKIHDNDKNNALDGLEMLQAALHQDDSFKKLDRDTYLQNASDELNHIVEVIDEFLLIADTNRDGLLHYPEYMKAVSESREAEQNIL